MAQRSTVTTADGAELAVHVEGEDHRPVLMLVTGLSGAASFWEPALGRLAQRLRVVRLDQRGVAASTRGTLTTTIDVLADDCLAVLDALGVRHPLLLGHSTGGVILQSMALKRPAAFAGLILSATWARPSRYMKELFEARRAVLDAIPKAYSALLPFLAYPPDWINRHWPEVGRMMSNAPVAVEQQAIIVERIAALLAFDRSAELGRIRVPTLVQGADDDLIVPAFLQRELHGMMPGSELTMLASGGHFFPVSRTDEFIGNVIAFADRIGHLRGN